MWVFQLFVCLELKCAEIVPFWIHNFSQAPNKSFFLSVDVHVFACFFWLKILKPSSFVVRFLLIQTFSSAKLSSFSCWGGILRRRTSQASFNKGMTLRKISVEMKSEQMGSAISHPNCLMRIVDIITPTLPSVSASTCRNTPANREAKCHPQKAENHQDQ